MSRHICALAGFALSLMTFSVQARVEVQWVPNSNAGALLAAKVSEDIAPGDYENLLKGIMQYSGLNARRIVLLDSIGGSIPEALRMGRLLRETGFEVIVPSQGLCQGACVYLLAAGTKRTVRGAVGIHRPYYPHGDSAAAKHSRHTANPRRYLREMNVEPTLVDEMQRIAPGRVRLLSQADLAEYGLH